TCGNPLLQQWVKEEMLRTQQTSSRMYYTYKKAYESLSKCPIVFEHPYQAVQLDGIGPKIVDMLTDKLKEYCQEHGLPMPPAPHKGKKRPPPSSITDDDGIQVDENGVPIPFRPKKRTKPYVPQYRTGGYGILLALLDLHDYGRCDATQQQIVRLAQNHCNASYTLAEPGKNYTAWNSMSQLVSKEYVYKSGSPKKYQLTETGVELAQKLKEINQSREAGGSGSGSGSTSASTPRSRPATLPTKQDLDALVAREPITETLRPSDYEIVLVVDSREIQMRQNRTYFQDSLAAKGVPCVTRSLDLGDVMWIARPIGSTNQAEELFLDYIVERKRLDDLVFSIKDGRFIEQKTRLKRSGANKVIYVVENYNREEAERFGLQAVQTAMSSTQIIDGIFLKRTNSIDETVDYLVSATKLVKRMYQDFTLHAIPGHIITRQNYLDLKQAYKKKAGKKEAYLVSTPLFGQLNSKNGSTSVHEVYLRMLMTIRGVNAEKALSLMKVYPTPKSLLTAFQGKSPEEAKDLAKVATQDQINRRRWGAKISESLYAIW
ncbi:hypothetical protein MUCCIDRAFT_128147, partial [Mucor lusitanicus CBS 277.49]